MSMKFLRYIGFCGIDDSITNNIELLELISSRYSNVEWGILFHQQKTGTPRYASKEFLRRIIEYNSSNRKKFNLAGHLCGDYCQQILTKNFEFIDYLHKNGFQRIQINATRANDVFVDLSKVQEYVNNILEGIKLFPSLEFIIQCNDETRCIWEILLPILNCENNKLYNVSFLFDASCGLGKEIESIISPLDFVQCGYAGGIGPYNISKIIELIIQSNSQRKPIWIDMESSLRVKILNNGSDKAIDSFSIEAAFSCITQCKEYLSDLCTDTQ